MYKTLYRRHGERGGKEIVYTPDVSNRKSILIPRRRRPGGPKPVAPTHHAATLPHWSPCAYIYIYYKLRYNSSYVYSISCIVVVGVIVPRKSVRHFFLHSVNAPPNPSFAISVYGYVLTCKVFLRWMEMRQRRWRSPVPSERA